MGNCLKEVELTSKEFNLIVFGNIFLRKLTLEAGISGIQWSPKMQDFTALMCLEMELHKEYDDLLMQEKLLWYQKSCENWVRLGDRNTKCFHT